MAIGQLASVLRCIHRLAGASGEADRTDRELLERFAARRDEAAFADVVRRHGPMVLGVCWRVLRHEQDAEDVFQATFLVLARKAGTIAWRDGVGNWLYEVAYRLAMELKGRSARRRARERQVGMMRASETPADGDHNELAIALDEELHQLPERFRACLLLCVFEGKTRDEAAQELGCSLRTVKHRLERGRSLLRQRLARRGLTLAAVLLAHDAGRAVLSATLVRSTSRAAMPFAAGSVSSRAAALAEGALSGMFAVKLKITAMVVLTLTLLAAGAGLAVFQAPAGNPGESARGPSPKPPEEPRAETQGRVDAYGDPLPGGALARLGTVRLRQGGQIHALALPADCKLLASGGSDNAVRLWQLPDGKEIRRFGGLRPVLLGSAVALTPDGKTLAAGDNGQIFLWETATGKEKRRLTFLAYSLAFSPDGKVLAVGGREGPIGLWDAATGKELHRLRGHPGQVNSLAFSSDGKRLLSGGLGKNVLLWDASTGEEIRSFRVDPERVNSVALSHDGKMVAAGSQDRFLYLWDAATGKVLQHIQAVNKNQWVFSVAFSPDDKTLAILDSSGPIRLWDVATGKEKKQFVGHTLGFGRVLFSADGKFLLSGCYDKTIRIWNVATGKEVRTFGGHHGTVEAVVYSPDGKMLATRGEDRTIRLWDTRTFKELHCFKALPEWAVHTLAFSPDSKVLATGEGSTIRLRDVATGEEIRRLTGHGNHVLRLTFAPDGKTLASGALGGEIKLWDPATGQARITMDTKENFWMLWSYSAAPPRRGVRRFGGRNRGFRRIRALPASPGASGGGTRAVAQRRRPWGKPGGVRRPLLRERREAPYLASGG
jgi:RNA polymerase sigma factor (sigma-70 family)